MKRLSPRSVRNGHRGRESGQGLPLSLVPPHRVLRNSQGAAAAELIQILVRLRHQFQIPAFEDQAGRAAGTHTPQPVKRKAVRSAVCPWFYPQIFSIIRYCPLFPVGAVLQRAQCPIVPLAPAVGIRMVADGRLCHTVFLCIQNQGLPIPGCLCYLIHSKQGSPASRFRLSNFTVSQIHPIRTRFPSL